MSHADMVALLAWLGFFVVSFHSCFCGHFGAHDGVSFTRQWAGTPSVKVVFLVDWSLSCPVNFRNFPTPDSTTGMVWPDNTQLARTSSHRNATAAEYDPSSNWTGLLPNNVFEV